MVLQAIGLRLNLDYLGTEFVAIFKKMLVMTVTSRVLAEGCRQRVTSLTCSLY